MTYAVDHRPQELVARRVTLPVVQLLEVVHVHEGQHEGILRAVGAIDLAAQRLLAQSPGEGARQVVQAGAGQVDARLAPVGCGARTVGCGLFAVGGGPGAVLGRPGAQLGQGPAQRAERSRSVPRPAGHGGPAAVQLVTCRVRLIARQRSRPAVLAASSRRWPRARGPPPSAASPRSPGSSASTPAVVSGVAIHRTPRASVALSNGKRSGRPPATMAVSVGASRLQVVLPRTPSVTAARNACAPDGSAPDVTCQALPGSYPSGRRLRTGGRLSRRCRRTGGGSTGRATATHGPAAAGGDLHDDRRASCATTMGAARRRPRPTRWTTSSCADAGERLHAAGADDHGQRRARPGGGHARGLPARDGGPLQGRRSRS